MLTVPGVGLGFTPIRINKALKHYSSSTLDVFGFTPIRINKALKHNRKIHTSQCGFTPIRINKALKPQAIKYVCDIVLHL